MAHPEAETSKAVRAARREAAVLALLALACCAFFWKAVTLRGVFFYYDHALQNYPFRLFFAEGLRQWRLRLWTPDLFCGFPLFAESQGNALYPPFLVLFALLKPWVAYNYYTVLHFFLAGAFTYVLARVMYVSRSGSFLAGVCYMLAGPILYHAHHTNIVVAVCWLPLLLALAELTFRRRSVAPLLGFAVASAFLVLGAQPQYTLYCALTVGIFLLWRLRLVEVIYGSGRAVAVLVAAFGLAGLLSVLLAAAQVLPLLELVGLSSRGAVASSVPLPTGLMPANLLTLMLPHYFGSPGLGSYWGAAGPGVYSELTLFVGTASLLLALTAALGDRRRGALFFAALGLFALIFSLEFSGGVYGVFARLPVFSSSRFPSRFAFVGALCAAVLAGMGLDLLSRAADRRRLRRAALASVAVVLVLAAASLAVTHAAHRDLMPMSREQLAAATGLVPFDLQVVWTHLHATLPRDVVRLGLVVVAGCALLLACSRGLLRRRACVALWCVIAFAELAYVGREFNAVTSPSLYLRPPALAEALKKLPPGRIFRYRLYDPWWTGMRFGDFPSTRGHALHPEPYATCLDKLPHNANMLWGIPSVSGFSPLQTLALKTLLGQPDNSATVIEFNLTHPIDLLGARYIVTPRQQMPAPLRLVTRVEDISIFENPNALPRAFLVHRTDLASDPAMAVAALQWEGFDYRRTVIVHEAPALLPDLEPVDTAGESAEVVSDTGDLVTVRTAVEQPAYLVLADQDYPGWQAEVDGRKAALARVDYMLKGVRLEPGEHTVRFVFRPASFRIGLWLSLCGVALLGGAAAFVRWRPGGPKAEAERLLDGPYGRRAARLVGLSGAVFLVLGPLLSAELWRDAKAAVTPRVYAATAARVAARYRAGDDDFQAAYGLVRDALLLHPSDPSLRIDVAGHGGRLARELLEQGRLDEARAVAAEVVLLVPQEARAREAILWALSRRKP